MTKQKRIYSKYLFKTGNKIKHGGITINLKTRGYQHKCTWPNGHIVKVGRLVTKNSALRWEREKGFQVNGHN